jgi:DNA-binding CsgD family transcriptional regulator
VNGRVLRLSLKLDDPDLADRVAELLSDVPGFELVGPEAQADAVLVSPETPREDAGQILSAREQEVLSLLAEGASNKEIARQLGISVHTAKFHVGSVIDKLDATGRTDAVAHAARIGVLHL